MIDTYTSNQILITRADELSRTDELARYFEERLSAMPEVERFVTRVRPQNADITVTFPDSLNLTHVPVAIKEQMVAHRSEERRVGKEGRQMDEDAEREARTHV